MSTLRTISIGLALAVAVGCAGRDAQEPAMRYASELSRFLQQNDEGIYDRDERCLSLWKNYSAEVIDEGHVLFRRRNELWINKLRSRCPSLRSGSTEVLVFKPTGGSQLCELDTLRQVPFGSRTMTGGPSCALGTFHHVAEPFIEPVLEARQ